MDASLEGGLHGPADPAVTDCWPRGKSNQQIADELFVVLDTVKKHVGHILDKLGAANRSQAVARAPGAWAAALGRNPLPGSSLGNHERRPKTPPGGPLLGDAPSPRQP
jgi:Bacterial regulatory proteins, luxR family